MVIGLLTLFLYIPSSTSLKDKRRILNSLKDRLSASFNVSVAEVGEQDKWQKSTVAVAHIGVTKPVVNSVMSNILNSVEMYQSLQVINHEMELLV